MEVNVEKLRAEYQEYKSTKTEYDKNSDAIDKNNAIDIQIRNNDVFIRDIENHINTWKDYCKTENEKYQLQTWKNLLEELKSWKTQQ